MPKVNPEIWIKLNRTASRQDLQIVSIQRALVKASTALANSAELLLKSNSGTSDLNTGNLLAINTDAPALLGHATRQLSMHCRQAIKPFLTRNPHFYAQHRDQSLSFYLGMSSSHKLTTSRHPIRLEMQWPHHGLQANLLKAKGKESWKHSSRNDKSSFLGRRGGKPDCLPWSKQSRGVQSNKQ